ncbi:MAG TPA: tyrosine-type recombinase/integrase [Pyrinomonadaceae bacterium]|jgi:integrase
MNQSKITYLCGVFIFIFGISTMSYSQAAKLSVKFRVYDLRHSCATLLLVAGENPKVVSERLGHASIVLTLDTYSYVLPSMQQSATEKLENILYSKTGTQ